jgi:transcriptional regulator with XRE-family HTH domain
MESITDCLATNIRALRKEKGFTQGELAQKAKISLIFLQGIESKRKWVSPDTAKALAKALDVKEADLFKDCFKNKKAHSKKSRIKNPKLDHVPDDIMTSLATTCVEAAWKWEAIRWIIKGFEEEMRSSA